MTDEQLNHHCLLATIVADMIRHPDFDPAEYENLDDQRSMYRILAEAFIELQRRQGIKPRFRVTAA